VCAFSFLWNSFRQFSSQTSEQTKLFKYIYYCSVFHIVRRYVFFTSGQHFNVYSVQWRIRAYLRPRCEARGQQEYIQKHICIDILYGYRAYVAYIHGTNCAIWSRFNCKKAGIVWQYIVNFIKLPTVCEQADTELTYFTAFQPRCSVLWSTGHNRKELWNSHLT
jgi:hypothetical protein